MLLTVPNDTFREANSINTKRSAATHNSNVMETDPCMGNTRRSLGDQAIMQKHHVCEAETAYMRSSISASYTNSKHNNRQSIIQIPEHTNFITLSLVLSRVHRFPDQSRIQYGYITLRCLFIVYVRQINILCSNFPNLYKVKYLMVINVVFVPNQRENYASHCRVSVGSLILCQENNAQYWVCLKTAGHRRTPQNTAGHRRTPQNTAGRLCNDRRTPQLHPNDQYERLEKLLSQCFDVQFTLFRHI